MNRGKGDLKMTRYYINRIKKEMQIVPNSNEYSHERMLQQGFAEVTKQECDGYIKSLKG